MPQAESFDILIAQRRIFESSLRPMERLVALAILDFYSVKSPNPFPGVNLLARRTGLDRKTVMRAIDGLNEAGAITVIGRKGAANRYLLAGLMGLASSDDMPVRIRDRSSARTSPTTPPVPDTDQSVSDTSTGPSGGPPPVPLMDPKDPTEGTQGKEPKIRAHARSPQVSIFPGETLEASAHRAVVDWYFERFTTEHGERPVFDAEDGRAIKTLLKKAGNVARACEFIDRAFRSFRRSSVTIKQIARDPDGFTVEAPRRPAAITQPVNDRALAAADEAEARADDLARAGSNVAKIVRLGATPAIGAG